MNLLKGPSDSWFKLSHSEKCVYPADPLILLHTCAEFQRPPSQFRVYVPWVGGCGVTWVLVCGTMMRCSVISGIKAVHFLMFGDLTAGGRPCLPAMFVEGQMR